MTHASKVEPCQLQHFWPCQTNVSDTATYPHLCVRVGSRETLSELRRAKLVYVCNDSR